MSRKYWWVESLKSYSGIFGCELPIDFDIFYLSIFKPRIRFSFECFFIFYLFPNSVWEHTYTSNSVCVRNRVWLISSFPKRTLGTRINGFGFAQNDSYIFAGFPIKLGMTSNVNIHSKGCLCHHLLTFTIYNIGSRIQKLFNYWQCCKINQQGWSLRGMQASVFLRHCVLFTQELQVS